MQGFIGCMFAHSNVHENDQESVAASGLLVLPWISCLEGLAGTVLLWRELLANTVSFALMLFFWRHEELAPSQRRLVSADHRLQQALF